MDGKLAAADVKYERYYLVLMEKCVAIYMCEMPPAQLLAEPTKTVVLWGHENLLGYSVELLLNTRKDLNLIKISDQLGQGALLERVEIIRPDVVVIYQLDSTSNADLPVRLMQNQQRLKVIIVNLENNSVEVFSKQKVRISEGTDLLSIVEGCPRLPCPIN